MDFFVGESQNRRMSIMALTEDQVRCSWRLCRCKVEIFSSHREEDSSWSSVVGRP